MDHKEFDLFWKAIEQIEKWTKGKEDFIEKYFISGVHKKRGVIFEYLVKKSKEEYWLTKEQAIDLTIKGKLHAIIVHLKNGTSYLRPEYGS